MKYRTRRKLQDAAWVVFGILFIALIVVLVVGSLWIAIAAPCEYTDWMPTKDVPNRCLQVDVR